MKTLSGSIVVLAGAIVFGSAKLAQALALSAGWQDTPVSMLVIGSTFSLSGFAVLIWGLRTDTWQTKTLSGAILILSGAVVFGFGKTALAIAASAGRRDIPVEMLAIGCTFSLSGFGVLICGLIADRRCRSELRQVS